ncbi:helix-turn-helix domain-containing protein [Selenihalanaerobacter shriftii]|uniref:DNA-binding transcriptional regulator, XRE-family HTH domain n=1 Tax=Selenihalanaerobacter shriftii TaxID=142842 RepID=A0A1T4NGV1_9FIRM|nr:helix-turn-helix transcriptional regulator [Selenihalanaerobacter shriftii]SJZ78581.1 DNA-binding transcriptional regulator, XRE-family HTH domain [Selenihalanaerobacter shriftii]
MTLGEKIRETRKKRGLTLKESSRKIGISYSFLSAIERNIKSPSLITIKQISKALNISIIHLFNNQSEKLKVGNKLKLLRKKRNLSISKLAKLTDIDEEELIKLENNEIQSDLKMIKKLTDVLKVNIDYFLTKNVEELKVGQRIKEVRQYRGMTVTKLAEKSGLSSGLISQIENQYTLPSVSSLESISKALGKSIHYFLLEHKGIQELMSFLAPEVREMLGDFRVQSILKAVSDFDKEEMKNTLNYIQFLKQNRD